MTIPECDRAYIAGLFDGEGCFTFKRRMKKRKEAKKSYPTWDIRIEINMTDESVIRWVCNDCSRVIGFPNSSEIENFFKE